MTDTLLAISLIFSSLLRWMFLPESLSDIDVSFERATIVGLAFKTDFPNPLTPRVRLRNTFRTWGSVSSMNQRIYRNADKPKTSVDMPTAGTFARLPSNNDSTDNMRRPLMHLSREPDARSSRAVRVYSLSVTSILPRSLSLTFR
jgi:hypothetical protein